MNQPISKVANLMDQMNYATDNLTNRFPISCMALVTTSPLPDFENLVNSFDCEVRVEKKPMLYTLHPKNPKEGQHNEQSLTLFVLGLALCHLYQGTKAYLYMTNPLQELINDEVETPYFHHSQVEKDSKLKTWLQASSQFRVDPYCLTALQMAGFSVPVVENPIDLPASNLKLLHDEMKNWKTTSQNVTKAVGL